ASRDRAKLATEACSVYSLLTTLRYRVEEARSGDPWFIAVRTLGVENGPLEQFKVALEQLASKLGHANGLRKIGKMLTWKFDKTEIDGILSRIERLKTLVGLALANDLFTLSRAIKDDVTAIKVGVAEIQVSQRDEERRTISEWLSSLNFKATQSDVFKNRQDGTGQWLLDSTEFKHWVSGTQETLWCPGIRETPSPDEASYCTFLTFKQLVLGRLCLLFENENVAIACIYCNYKERTEQTASNLIASLLKQLVQDQSVTLELSNNVRSLYRQHINRNTRPTLGEFVNALQSEVRRYSKVFIIVDALDECPEDNGTRAHMLSELLSLASTVNVMFTSRYLTSIERDFQGSKRLDILANDDDIRRYIEDRIQREHRLARHVGADRFLQETIVKTTVRNVRGMIRFDLLRFLLARLHMDSLVHKTNRREVRRALENLPKGVDAAYEEAMERIEAQIEDDKKLAQKVLSWISYAFRPLFLSELQHALAVEPGMTHMDSDAIEDEEILTSVCAGLVVVDEESSIIRLVHYTAQEYFERNRESRFPHAQVSIAATCLTFLSFDEFEKGDCYSHDELERFPENKPFYEYAAQYWGHHARGEVEKTCKEMAVEFFQNGAKVLCATQHLCFDRSIYTGFSHFPRRDFSGVHMSSYFGLTEIINYLLENGSEADSTDEHGRRPLSYAASNGHHTVVKLLLKREDVVVNTQDIFGETSVLLAAREGHESVMRLLLKREDIEVNTQNRYGQTPLSSAALNGHESVMRLLLKREDVVVNTQDNFGETSVLLAARRGHESVMRLLLKREDIEMNLQNHDGETALSVAVKYGHGPVVKLLQSRIHTL
ncbi:MAG: hypothetical protein M1830_002174, partial [Pleopsidium flavum]